MKKMISLFLALLMVFSVATVAFAADDDTQAPVATDAQDEGATAVDAQDEGAEPATDKQDTEEKKDESDSKSAEELLDQIKDMPVGTAKALLKVGKIVLKFVKIFAKLGIKFGLIDTDDIVKSVAEAFGLDPETELPEGTSEAIRVLI